MTGNSSKFFRKILKNSFLVTASGAAIMLSSSGALGAATIDANATFSTGVGLTPAAKFAGGTLQYTDNAFTVDADEAVNITAMDINGKAPGIFTVNENISLGSVSGVAAGGTAFPVTVNDTFTLTLTGTGGLGIGTDIYNKLGAITLGGATAKLTINSAAPALITLAGTIDGAGNLLVSTPTTFNAAIGAVTPLASVTFNNGNGLNAATAKAITTTTVTIGKDAANNASAVSTGKIGGAVNFTADGQLTVDGGVTGAVTTAVNDEGTLIVTAGNVVNVGDGASSLKKVTFNNVAASNAGNIFATDVMVGNAGTDVTTGTVNGAIDFAAAGKLNAGALVTGTAVFNADGQLTLGNGITGAVTTAANNEGTVIVTAGDIQAVGVGGKSIKKVTFNNVAASNAGNIFATDVTVGNAGTDVTTGTVNGAIDFAAAGKLTAGALVTGTAVLTADGQLTLGNGITGDITSAGNNGTVIVTAGNVANVGTVGSSLKKVTFNNAGASNAGNIFATDVTVGNAGTDVTTGTVNGAIDFTAAGKLNAGALVTGTAVFNADGQLTLGNGITGAVTTAVNNEGTVIVTAGDVANLGIGVSLLKKVTFNNAGASNAGNIFATDVTVGNAGTDVTTGTVNGAIDFTAAGKLNAGALVTGTAVFNADGQLTLGNGITGAVTTAANNEGTVIVTAGDIQAVGVGGKSIKKVTFNNAGASNAGNIFATDVTVGNAGTDVTTGTVNGAIDFTAAGKLTAGALVTGTAVLTTDGQLTLDNGITGDITSAGNNGTVIVTAGNVANVGTVGSSLKKVTFNNAGASNAGNIFATDVTVGNAGTDVTTGTVNGAIDFTAAGKLNAGALVTGTAVFNADGQLTLDNGITGDITSAGNNGTVIVTAGNVANVGDGASSLKKVTFNNVAASNAGNIFATDVTVGNAGTDVTTGTVNGAIDFTAAGKLNANGLVTGTAVFNADGQLTLGNGITGVVTTAVNDEDTLIVTAGDVIAVGGVGKSLKQVTFNGVSTLNGAIDAKTITINGAVTAKVGAITGNVNITSGTLTTDQVITGDLGVSGAGNLAGDAAATDVTGTVTLFGAGVVTIRDALNAAGVSVGGGTLNLRNAKGINFDVGAGAGTTVTVAAGGNVGNVQNATPSTGIGILTFAGAGKAGIIGNANSLSEVNVGAGAVAISGGVVKADAINLTDAGGASTISFADQAQVMGAILNTSGTNKKGIVTFTAGAGDSGIIGAIGDNGAAGAIETLNTKVDAGKVITLGGDVYTQNLVLDDTAGGNAVGTVEIGGNLTGDVTFGADANGAGGTLEFNGNAVVGGVPVQYTFDGAIVANADKGKLNVNTSSLTALNATVATIKAINIVDAKTLILDASDGDVTVLDASTIVFAGANSTLGFSNAKDIAGKNIKLADNIKAAAGGGGNLQFIGGATKALTVTSTDAVNKTLGAAANKLTSLIVKNNITIANTIDASNIPLLNVVKGATLLDQSMTTAAIPIINIGADGGAGAGPATHTIDVSTAAAVNLSGGNVKFADAGSTFKLQNTVAGNKTVTLTNNIVGGVGGAGNGGIVELNAADVGGTLTINGNKTLGTDANKLQTLKLSGNGTIVLGAPGLPVDYFATNLDLSIKAVTLGNITQPLAFSGDTTLTETGDIASVDFKGFNATINMNNGTNITGAVTNTGVATNNGTINFAGTGSIGGNISGLATLKVGAGAVELKTGGATKITEIQGTGANTLTLPADFKLTGAINSTGGTAVKLNFTNGGSVSGVVGTAASPVGGITTAGTTTFTSAVNSKGPITTAGNTTFSNSLNNIGDVTTSGTTIFTGAYTNTGTAKFGGTTSFASTFNNTGTVTTAGTTTFTSAVNSKGPITTAGNTTFSNSLNNIGDVTTSDTTTFTGAYTNTGTAKFGGTTSFADTFNNTGAVTLVPGSINNFAKNVTATSFVASNATMNFGNSLAFNSGLTGSGTTINLGSGQLAYTAQGSFTDTLTLNSNFDGTTNSGGNILITGANSKMDLSGVTKLKLVISTTNFDVNNVNPNTKYTLILAQDGGSLTELSSADIIETTIGGQENRFLKWTLNPSSLVLTASNISQDVIDNEKKTGSLKDVPADINESLEILARAPADSEAGQFEDKLGFIIDNKALVIEVIDSLQPDTVRTGDAIAAINTQATSGAITSAITSLSSRMNNLQVANNQAAVSAGEEDEAKFGIWATPFVGNSTQKMRNNVNGNKSNFNGATVGFDGMLNDNLVLGVAYTRADSKIKQKNDKIGDSSKVNSNIYSIYGLYNLPTNNLFFEAVGSYGDSRVKNYTKHLLPTARNTITSQIAHGKYKSRSYTGQVMVGYDYVTAQVNLTPMAGIRYSNIKDSGYTETGTTLQNLIVKGKKYNIVEGLAGAKVSTNVNVDQVILTPELYGLINYGFKNKAPAIDARLQGMDAPFPTNSFKSPKTSYNLGAGVTAKYQMMEYGVNYDVNIASKYFAQQGGLKVRVNF